MKKLILTGVILAILGYFLYKKRVSQPNQDGQLSTDFPSEHIEVLDMENIIDWFMKRQVQDFMSPDIMAIAVNLKKLEVLKEQNKDLASLIDKLSSDSIGTKESILLGFFDKSKVTLLPSPNVLIFTADKLTHALSNQFNEKAIIVLE